MLKRIIKHGIIGFWRNGWVSLVSTFTMTLALFVIGSLIFFNALLTSTINRVEDKIDISVYFKDEAKEEDIFALQKSLESLIEVKSVDYVSKDKALEEFRTRHGGNALIMSSLEELGFNPLQASLNIRANDFSQYDAISAFLASGAFKSFIEKINYYQNKIVIDRLAKIIGFSRRIGLAVSLTLAFIAGLVTFNTIRLAIYNSRDEIKVMRLVGATNNYIRAPFVVEGGLYGIFSAAVALLIFLPLTYWLGPKTQEFFGGPNIFDYYISNFFWIASLIFGIAVFLGSLSSVIAIRRHLQV